MKILSFGKNNSLDLLDGFDNFFRPFPGAGLAPKMKTDIKETDDSYIIETELPGVKKENIEITLENEYLEIAVKVSEEEKEEKANFIRRERKVGAASRSFYVGDLKFDDFKAVFEDGILRITFPKIEEDKAAKKNKINIE